MGPPQRSVSRVAAGCSVDEPRGERDAWNAQAERNEVAARELRILVQGAQALARALPANVEDVGEDVGEDAPTVWQRLRRGVAGA